MPPRTVSSHRRVSIGGFVTALLVAALPAQELRAPTRLWRTGEGDWFEAARWSEAARPGASDVVAIDHASRVRIAGETAHAHQIRMSTTAGSDAALTIENGAFLITHVSPRENLGYDAVGANIGEHADARARVNVGGEWRNASGINVGGAGAGSLVVESGARVTNELLIVGSQPGSRGDVIVRGILENRNAFGVGDKGAASLVIEAGGAMTYLTRWGVIASHPESTGHLEVGGMLRGSAQSDLIVGNYGVGTLRIRRGGLVSTRKGSIAHLPVGRGEASVAGAWDNSAELLVGYSGAGRLNVERGGSVTSAKGFIGHNPTARGVATIAGVWRCAGAWHAGYGGHGQVEIETGGELVSEEAFLASQPGTRGVVTVRGGWTNRTSLSVGERGAGALAIARGGAVTFAGNGCLVGAIAGAEGLIEVAGELRGAGDLSIGYAAPGELRIAAGGIVTSARGSIGRQRAASGAVRIAGDWRCAGDLDVGFRGSGSLALEHGGVLQSGSARVGAHEGARGEIAVNGAWSNAAGLIVGGEGSGSIVIDEGSRVSTGFARIHAGSSLVFAGGEFAGALEVVGGTVVVRRGAMLAFTLGREVVGGAVTFDAASAFLIEPGARATIALTCHDGFGPGNYRLMTFASGARLDGVRPEAVALRAGDTGQHRCTLVLTDTGLELRVE